MRTQPLGADVDGPRAKRPDGPDLLRRTEVAAMLDISPSTLYRWVHAGTFPDYDVKDGPKYRRYRRATVLKWLAAKEAERERLDRLARLARERRVARGKGCP